MKETFVKFLLLFHNKKSSHTYKIISLACGTVFFLLILPAIFVWIGNIIDSYYSINGNTTLKYIISTLAILKGLFFIFWATYTQITVGKGTPAPNAPTQKLIVSGPYKLTRNPIEFGAIFYYFGIGTAVQSYTVGIVCFALGLILGSAYHKFIEEEELENRFGEEYKKYKKEVPFLIPKLRL